MKKLFYIDDTPANTISYYHLACFLIALPFDRFYSELILVSFVIHTIIHLEKRRLKLILSKEIYIVWAVFLLALVCVVYSIDKKQGLSDLSRQLAIFLFPLTLALNSLDLNKYKTSLPAILGYASLIAVAYLYVDALITIHYFKLPFTSLFGASFLNHNFSSPIGIHATYLSMYVAFSICNFLVLFLENSSKGKRFFFGFCIALLTVGLIQLSSRAVLIALLLIVFFVFPFFLVGSKRKLIFFVTAFIIFLIISFTIFRISSFNQRYFNEVKKDLSAYSENVENTEPRMQRWIAATELVKQSPVIGYGSGSEITLLKEKYFEKKLYKSYLNQFNAHNEYLSFLIKSGIAGLAIYLFVLFYGIVVSWKKKDVSFVSFLFIIATTSVSENILDLNKGIFFYGFFFAFFLLSNKKSGPAPTVLPTGNQSQ